LFSTLVLTPNVFQGLDVFLVRFVFKDGRRHPQIGANSRAVHGRTAALDPRPVVVDPSVQAAAKDALSLSVATAVNVLARFSITVSGLIRILEA